MKNIFLYFIMFLTAQYAVGQKKTVYGDLKSTDSTALNIIKVLPDSFPAVSVIFEAVKDNQAVFNITKDRVKISEDEQPCQILHLNQIGENYPINISLIIDHSGSMSTDIAKYMELMLKGRFTTLKSSTGADSLVFPDEYTRPIDNAKRAVIEFIKQVNSIKDSIQIVGFSTNVDIYSSFTKDKKYLQSIVDSIDTDESTAFLDAINFSLDSIKKHSGIKIIVALTDGLDNSSHITIEEIIKKSKDLKVPVYTVGLGSVDKVFLSRISKETGGAFYYTNNSSSLTDIYKEIQERIHAIYDLQYVSENLSNNKSRRIKIEFSSDSLSLFNNSIDADFSEKVIAYLEAKAKKRIYIIGGVLITAMALGTTGIVFYYRRRKRKV